MKGNRKDTEDGARPFQAGIMLEEFLSAELDAIDIPHRRTHRCSVEDMDHKIDFVIQAPWTTRPFEIQITYMRKCVRKIRGAVAAAMRRTERGYYLYVEVIAGRKQSVAAVAEQVAKTLKEVVTRYRDFGIHNMLGLIVRANPRSRVAPVEKFSLEQAVGTNWFHTLIDKIEEARQEALMIESELAQAFV